MHTHTNLLDNVKNYEGLGMAASTGESMVESQVCQERKSHTNNREESELYPTFNNELTCCFQTLEDNKRFWVRQAQRSSFFPNSSWSKNITFTPVT